MRKIYVHVGAHKTASSFLQANLSLQRARLAEQGLTVVLRNDIIATDFAREAYDVSQGRHPPEEVGAAARASLAGLLPATGDVLVSNEDMLCHLDIEDFYQRGPAAVRYLQQAFEGWDLHLLLYVRRQPDYLESIYMQYVHLSRRLGFAQFMERAAGVDLSWLAVAEGLGRTLPAGRLAVRPFERIKVGGETAFYRDFLGLCGVPEPGGFDVEPVRGRAANRSYSGLGMEIARRVNPLLNGNERKLLRRFLQEHFSTATHPRAELLDAADREAIFERYRESNRLLFERHDLGAPGEALGYY